ncbi:MAG: response regulator [Nitrospirae bacterium]|nr:response regulator [Nitrospirota bacterium]
MQEKHSILIIEDSRELVDLLYRKFGETYTLSFALDGEEGLALAASLKPDLVLLDVNLPKKGGFSVLKDIRANKELSGVTVLMITGQSDTESVVKGFSLGAADYIVKPFNFVELSARIESQLTIRQLQRQVVDMERLNILREVAVSFNHEINNPLMSISTFAYFLEKKLDLADPDIDQSVHGIISEVARIADIVDKLSAATHAASVNYQPGLKMIDFSHLTE